MDFKSLRTTKSVEIKSDLACEIAMGLISDFRANKAPSLQAKVHIQDEKILSGAPWLFGFSLLLAASICDLKRTFRASFREYFVGENGVRLIAHFKREQRAFNSVVSSFTPAGNEPFIAIFKLFSTLIKEQIEPELRQEFAKFLTKAQIWSLSQSEQDPYQNALKLQKDMLNSWEHQVATPHPADIKQPAKEQAPEPVQTDLLAKKLSHIPATLTPIKEQKPSPKQNKAIKLKKGWAMQAIKDIFKKLAHLDEKRFGKEFKKEHYAKAFKKNEPFWLKLAGGYSRAEILLLSVAMIEGVYDFRSQRFEELAKIYSEYISFLDVKELKRLAIFICNLAHIYTKLAQMNEGALYTFDDFSKRLFNITHRSDQRGFTPIVLLLYTKLNKSDFRLCVGLLERFYVLRLLCGRNEDLGLFFWHIFEYFHLNGCCNAVLILKKRLFEDRFISVPKKGEVLAVLKNIKDNFYARYVLFWMELYLRFHNKKYRRKGLAMHYTLEHILPQAYKKYWNIKDESNIASQIYQIGNMTLLQDELNVAISNLAWLQKRTIMRLDREPMLINQSILELSRWSSGHIATRTKELSELFVQIWQPAKE